MDTTRLACKINKRDEMTRKNMGFGSRNSPMDGYVKNKFK